MSEVKESRTFESGFLKQREKRKKLLENQETVALRKDGRNG